MDTSPSQLLRSVADEVRKGRLQRRRGRERAQGGNDRTIDSDAEQTEARLQHDRERQREKRSVETLEQQKLGCSTTESVILKRYGEHRKHILEDNRRVVMDMDSAIFK
jgi:hypothetical protein